MQCVAFNILWHISCFIWGTVTKYKHLNINITKYKPWNFQIDLICPNRYHRKRGSFCNSRRRKEMHKMKWNYQCLLNENCTNDCETVEDPCDHPRSIPLPRCHYIGTEMAKPKQFLHSCGSMVSILNQANLRDLTAVTGLVISLKLDSNLQFYDLCDLAIRWMTLKNNMVPFLYYIKLCASFQSHWWIQTRATVQKCSIRVKIGDFFVLCVLEIWWMMFKINRAPLLS